MSSAAAVGAVISDQSMGRRSPDLNKGSRGHEASHRQSFGDNTQEPTRWLMTENAVDSNSRISLDRQTTMDMHRLMERAITGKTDASFRGDTSNGAKETSCLLDPRTSKFLGYWDVVGLSALIFTALFTPFEIANLPPSKSALSEIFIINRIVDTIFIADLCLQFFLAYEDTSVADVSERWVTNHSKITRHYLSGWFSIDFVSCAVSGFDFMGLGEEEQSADVNLQLFQVLRALRLIKLLRLMRLARLFRRWEKRLTFNYGTMALTKCVIYVLLTCHWCACVWSLQTLFAAKLMKTWRGSAGYCWEDGTQPADVMDAPDRNGIVCVSPGATWMGSFYLMMMTITSVGYGDISASNTIEQAVLSCLILVSALMWSQVISTFCLVLANANPADQEFYNAMDALNAFMALNAIPKNMRIQLRAYFHETRTLRLTRRHRELYSNMSPTLAALAFVEVNGRAMDALWIAKECTAECRFRIMDSMEIRVYAPGERTEHDALSIVQRGLAMHGGNLMRRHDAWGFDMFIQNNELVRSSEAKALHYLEVSAVRRSDLLRLIVTLAPSDVTIIRKGAARLALCRYVIHLARMAKTTPGSFLGQTGLLAGRLATMVQVSPEKVPSPNRAELSAGEPTDARVHVLEAKMESLQSSQLRMEALLIEMSGEMRARRSQSGLTSSKIMALDA